MIPLLKLKRISPFIMVLFSLIAFVSCVNEDNQLGLDLVKTSGGMDVLQSDATGVTLSFSTFKIDSLATGQNDNFVLGTYRDSYFGEVKASIYTSLGLQDQSGYDFSSIGEIDSVVLCLAYSMKGAFSADSSVKTDNMQINIYELSEDLDSTKQYSNSEVASLSNAIFSSVVLCDPLHGVILGDSTKQLSPHIRMKLDDSFVNKLRQGKFATQADFTAEFKGLKIEAKSSNDSYLACINMKSSNSGVYVYYHDANGNKGEYMINFTSNGYRFMKIDKDYSSSNLSVLSSTAPNDSLTSGNYIYLASLGVAESQITLTDLDTWYNTDSIKGAALNRAELILPVSELSTKTYLIPSSINVLRKQDDKFYYIEDQVATNNWLGNMYDENLNAYRIDITSYLQNYLLGKYDNCTLYLFPDARISSANRVVLTSPSHTNPPKLNIIYSHPAQD